MIFAMIKHVNEGFEPKEDSQVHVRKTFVLTRNSREKFDITGFELTMTQS